MALVRSNGLEFDVEVHGDPAGTPLLLVMGLGMPAALWPDEVVATFVRYLGLKLSHMKFLPVADAA